MITLQLTEDEVRLMREAALALELHMQSLIDGTHSIPGRESRAHRDAYREKVARAAHLYAKLAALL